MSPTAARWEAMYASGDFRRRWDSPNASSYVAAMVTTGVARPGDVTLDIGCGAGQNAVYLAQSGCRSVGLDVSGSALRLGAERAATARVAVDWVQGSALDLPVSDRTVDFALDNGCLHHLRLPDWHQYAGEVASALKPGARLLIAGGREVGEAASTAITEENIDAVFLTLFDRGPVTPVVAHAAIGELDANMCLLVRR